MCIFKCLFFPVVTVNKIVILCTHTPKFSCRNLCQEERRKQNGSLKFKLSIILKSTIAQQSTDFEKNEKLAAYAYFFKLQILMTLD